VERALRVQLETLAAQELPGQQDSPEERALPAQQDQLAQQVLLEGTGQAALLSLTQPMGLFIHIRLLI
jgi:hypothetical protein